MAVQTTISAQDKPMLYRVIHAWFSQRRECIEGQNTAFQQQFRLWIKAVVMVIVNDLQKSRMPDIVHRRSDGQPWEDLWLFSSRAALAEDPKRTLGKSGLLKAAKGQGGKKGCVLGVLFGGEITSYHTLAGGRAPSPELGLCFVACQLLSSHLVFLSLSLFNLTLCIFFFLYTIHSFTHFIHSFGLFVAVLFTTLSLPALHLTTFFYL